MSFSEALARKIEARFRNLETSMVRYRRGTVVAVDPLQVGLGASGSPVAATTLAADLAQDDDVHVAAWGNDMLVLGKTTSDPVTALPDPAYNNQETLLEVDTAGTYGGPYYWHCKYREATGKWHVIAAQSLTLQTGGANNTPAGADTWYTITSGPSITLPFAGTYRVKVIARMTRAGASGVAVDYDLAVRNATPTVLASGLVFDMAQQYGTARVPFNAVLPDRPASEVLSVAYKANASGSGAQVGIAEVTLIVTPTRLG